MKDRCNQLWNDFMTCHPVHLYQHCQPCHIHSGVANKWVSAPSLQTRHGGEAFRATCSVWVGRNSSVLGTRWRGQCTRVGVERSGKVVIMLMFHLGQKMEGTETSTYCYVNVFPRSYNVLTAFSTVPFCTGPPNGSRLRRMQSCQSRSLFTCGKQVLWMRGWGSGMCCYCQVKSWRIHICIE